MMPKFNGAIWNEFSEQHQHKAPNFLLPRRYNLIHILVKKQYCAIIYHHLTFNADVQTQRVLDLVLSLFLILFSLYLLTLELIEERENMNMINKENFLIDKSTNPKMIFNSY